MVSFDIPGRLRSRSSFFKFWFCQENHLEDLSLKELDERLQEFLQFYNNDRFHEGIGETPNQRFQRALEKDRTKFHSLPEDTNLDDILCLTRVRCLKKDNTFSYNGTSYTLTRNRRSITPKAKIKLHIHPGIKIRTFYKDEFIQEFPFTKPEI